MFITVLLGVVALIYFAYFYDFKLNYLTYEDAYYNQDGTLVEEKNHNTSLDTPISFGVSLNFNVSKVTTIFMSYNDFVALGVQDNGNTPLDFSFGLRFKL